MLSSFLSPPFARSSSLRLIAGAYRSPGSQRAGTRLFLSSVYIPKNKKETGLGFLATVDWLLFLTFSLKWRERHNVRRCSRYLNNYTDICWNLWCSSSPFISFTLIFFSEHKLLVVIRVLLCVRPLVCASTFLKIFFLPYVSSRDDPGLVCTATLITLVAIAIHWGVNDMPRYILILTNPQVNKFEPRSRSNRRPVYTVQYLSG